MKIAFTILFALLTCGVWAQVATVFDRRHLQAVNENAAARGAAEGGYQQSLDNIRKNADGIAINMASMALAETMIYRSLSEVDEAMANGAQAKQVLNLISSIYSQGSDIISIAENDPFLLLFAEEYARDAKEQGMALVNQVSSFVLREGENILINPNVRDELLTGILARLREIQTSLFAVKQSMYWAKVNGKLRTLNPYQDYINKDMVLMERVLSSKSILKE